MLLCRDFKFDAAHNLIHYHGKCERLHGHIISYIITASANGCTAIRIICASCSRASRTRRG